MLQIYIHGPRESGFLDLLPGARLEMEADADVLDEDFSLSEFSLPIDIPWTQHNRKLMGFAERLRNVTPAGLFFEATVYDQGVVEMEAAKLEIIGKEGNFNFTTGRFLAVVTGTKGLFGRQIKNKKLSDLNLGGTITWQGKDSREFATAHAMGEYPQWPHIGFAPAAIENFFDAGRSDADGEFIARDTVNTVVTTGTGWSFGRPTTSDPAIAATPGNAEYRDYRTIPFLRVQFVVRSIFEEMGYTVTGEFLENPIFKDLFLFNNHAIENYTPGHEDYNRSITPSNHVPSMLIVDYLRGLFSAFSIYPVFLGSSEVRLLMRKNLWNDRTIYSINGISDEYFTATNDREGEGYTIRYSWDGDGYSNDRIRDKKGKNMLGTAPTVDGLAALTVGSQVTTDDIALVTAENMYYQVANATTNPVKWEPFCENIDEYKSGEGDRTVDITLSTLCTYVEYDPGTALQVRRPYAGARLTGSYINNKGVLVKNDCPHKVFWLGRLTNSSNIQVPYTANHHLDTAGRQIFPFSLALQGENGIVNLFHKNWQDLKDRMEKVTVTLQANRRVLKGITENVFLEKGGVLFLVSRIEKTIPLGKTVQVELMV